MKTSESVMPPLATPKPVPLPGREIIRTAICDINHLQPPVTSSYGNLRDVPT